MSPPITSSQASGAASQRAVDPDEITLQADGVRWSGWTEIDVTRTLDSAVGRFSLKVPPTLGVSFPIRPGTVVEIGLGDGEPILTGSVDQVSAELSATSRSVTISGRDKASALVDSTVDLGVYEWREATLLQIVRDLIDPFGISIGKINNAANGTFPLFSASSTERVWSVLERGARQKGLLAYSLPDGTLALDQAGSGASTPVDIAEGSNLIRARMRWDHADRFKTYRVEGQSPGTDEGWGDSVISLAGEASDLEVLSHRVLTLRGEQGMTGDDCLIRARWEASVRRARSTALEVQVRGWRMALAPGAIFDPWKVNSTVYVSIPGLGIQGSFLISRVKFSRATKGGPVSSLTLVPEDSFVPVPTLTTPDTLGGFMVSDEGGEEIDF